ncbi:Leucine-rich repeat-containing G-protein coupled receptor 5 [Holothuria leucospilota]|uniref:Leucine-rich repeat-containing G-protein coupled receptor 5 n=1 Tax=Holothuria leucospilota TaxID=206669 RepID=A0A9Q1HBM8_HOLLE|nr:Leucine-rich repeat-containing G-protein coupled receptor 5 [Holothuria leucospilota]
MKSIFYRHLNRNDLTTIPENLLKFSSNLDKLELSDNNLQTLPESLFANVTTLSNVRVAGNNISSLPPTLFRNMSTLKSIDLSRNFLSDIPETLLADTVNLTSFRVTANKIKRLPDELFKATPNLANISFSSNELVDIPESIFNATPNLRMIDFVYNRLTELPTHVFDAVDELKYLQMSANKIKIIDKDWFCKVRLMEELDFSNNSLSIIPSGLFTSNKRIHQLRTIFLQRNNLTYVQMDAFKGLPNVSLICLFDNRINAIDSGAFSISSLLKLFLFNNDLQNLTNRSFAGSRLQEIHLYGNNITNISKDATKGIPTQPVWYLSCELLRRLETSDIKITCINENFAPRLRVDEPVSRRLKSEGFICTRCKSSPDYQCELCTPGTYTFGDNRCYPCPRGGFFQDAIGFKSSSSSNIGCKTCNNGTFVKSGGGKSAEDCEVCPEGTNQTMRAGFRACFCKDGYARTDRFGPCYRCNQTGLNCSGLQDYQSIMKGYYWYWKFPGADNEAYRKFVLNLLNESHTFDNNTFYSQQIPRVFKCPRPESCNANQTGDAPVRGTCSEGYYGWLCNKCASGYFSLLKKCVKCPTRIKLLIEAFFTTALSVVICYLIWTQYVKHKKRNTNERNLLDIIVSRFKICLGFYQVLGEFFSSIQEASWMGMFNFMGEIFSYITLNILRIFFRPQCVQESLYINPKIQFLISLLVIFLLTAVPVLLYQLKKAYLKRYGTSVDIQSRLSLLRAKISTVSLVLLFLTYPPICTAIFQMYRRSCVEFCADLKNQSCQFVLRSDFQIRCSRLAVYHAFAYLATVAYIVAFPLSLFFLLRKYCSPKITTVLVDSENVNGDGAPLLAVDCKYINVPIGLKFLCENYKPQFWYWEIIELTRKVTQTVLLTLLGWEDNVTILLTIGVSVLYLTLHARYRPMKSVLEQRLQVMFSLSVILINVLVATISMAVPDGFESKLAVIILLLNVSVVVIITVEAAVRVVVKTRRLKINRKVHGPQRQQQATSSDTLNME